ncbi:MAG: hypothetical protein KIT80_03000 [Chitinophagaceae bacterium]|nr:hypothetical protein [Chitinophagaceae bacterium]MCW5925853.1 hypothetical protein [Chitinophagaceae bacterium]
MKKLFCLAILFVFKSAYSQTLQTSNSLFQSRDKEKLSELSTIDLLPKGELHPRQDLDSVLEFATSRRNLEEAQRNILKLQTLLNDSTTRNDTSLNEYRNALWDFSKRLMDLKKYDEQLKIQSFDVNTKELEDKIRNTEQEMVKMQGRITELNNDFLSKVKENSNLREEVITLNNSLTNTVAKLKEADSINNSFIKTIYKLRLKLNEPDLEGIFKMYKEINKRYQEIENNLELVAWFTEKKLNKEDAHIFTEAHKQLNRSFANIERLKKKEERDSADFAKVLEEYKKLDLIFKTGSIDVQRLFIQYDQQLEQSYKDASKSFKALKSEIDKYAVEYKNLVEDINSRIKKMEKEESKEQHFSVLGGFKKILEENGAFIPEIDVFAQKKFGEDTFGGYGQIRLFTGTGIANNNVNTKLNFFVPEASSFGIATDFGLGFNANTKAPSGSTGKRIKDIGLNAGFYMMGKHLFAEDSTIIKPTLGLCKVGLEVLPFQNFFSLRANINGLFTSNRVFEMQQKFQGFDASYWYTDVAFSTLLDIKNTPNFKIRVDINMIFLNQKMRDFLGSSDKILPQLKLELVTNF